MRALRPLSLQSELLIVLIAATLVISGVIGGFSYRVINSSLTREATRAVGIAADSHARELVTLLHLRRSRLERFVEFTGPQCHDGTEDGDDSCTRSALQELVETEGAIAATLTLPGRSPITVGQGPGTETVGEITDRSLHLATFRRPTEGSPASYTVAVSVNGQSIAARFPMSDVEQIFADRTGLGASGESFLADAEGYFLTPARYPSASGHSHPVDAAPMRRCLAGGDGEVIAHDYREPGVEVVHGFRYIEEIGGGCVMAHVDAQEAFVPVRAFTRHALLLSIGAAAAAVAVSLLLARGLARPLRELTDSVSAMRDGDYAKPIPLTGPREVRSFADSFSTMAHELRKSQEARDALLGMVAHDLRSPLTSISVSAERLLRESADPRRIATTILHAAERMSHLINDLLDVARIEAGRLAVDARPCSTAELLAEAVEAAQLVAGAHEIRTEISDRLPPITADRDRILQVFSNLIGNAIKFSPEEGTISIGAKAAGSEICFWVANSGPGLSEEQLGHLFDRFWQARRADRRGAGLGLAISKGIVDAHGGRIWAESTPGVETRFLFTALIAGADATAQPQAMA